MKQKFNAESLLHAIGEIRDDFIADADVPARRRIRKFPIVLAAVLLCMALTVSALAAADVEPVYNFLYQLSPAIAQKLKPVRLSCVDNGIELEVLSANVEDDAVQVYLALRDLEGDRVDETTDLFDSYRIHMTGNMTATCSFARYDESTKTACFLVEIWADEGRFDRNKVTFSMDRFISGKQEFAGLLDVDLSSAEAEPAAQTDVITRGYGWADEAWQDFSVDQFLVPGKILSPMEDVTITGMGWIDGYLHIQTHYANILDTDAHGGVCLMDTDGNLITDVYEVAFWDEARSGSYWEQIFAVTPEQLADLRLMGLFYSADMLVEGHWEITFPVG